jgi:hypothetical protein
VLIDGLALDKGDEKKALGIVVDHPHYFHTKRLFVLHETCL